MSIQFGQPIPPHLSHPQIFILDVFIGLGVLLLITYLVDKLGTAMFHRGFAKPFYIYGRRIHHTCLYLIIPSAYGVVVGLFLLGYILIPWSSLWTRLEAASVVVVATLAIDFIGDRYWPKIRKNVFLHHEWFYALIPAYIFTYVVNVLI